MPVSLMSGLMNQFSLLQGEEGRYGEARHTARPLHFRGRAPCQEADGPGLPAPPTRPDPIIADLHRGDPLNSAESSPDFAGIRPRSSPRGRESGRRTGADQVGGDPETAQSWPDRAAPPPEGGSARRRPGRPPPAPRGPPGRSPRPRGRVSTGRSGSPSHADHRRMVIISKSPRVG